MTQQELQQFEIPGVLTFAASNGGLFAAHVTTPAAEATIYVQGAHLAHWKPNGHDPVLFLSDRAEYAPGKAIRGGIPVIFPWFGDRTPGDRTPGDRTPGDRAPGDRNDGGPGPAHGFARISDWQLAFAALSGSNEDPDLHLMWTLAPSELSRSLGFDNFSVGYRMTIGRRLTLELTVANDAAALAPLRFEEAFHTYFSVADVRQVSIVGLAGTEYLDKVDNMQLKRQEDPFLRLAGRTDRVYLNTAATCVLHDPAGERRITIAKFGSQSTVVWNPWAELTAKMEDMAPGSWLHMTCIETANVAENAITLQPGATHTMKVEISLELR